MKTFSSETGSFAELLIDIAKFLNLPEDLSLRPRKAACNSFGSPDCRPGEQLVNGVHDEQQNQIKPKETNKSHSLRSPRSDDAEENSANGTPNKRLSKPDEHLSIDRGSPSDPLEESRLRPCNGELNDCRYSNNSCNSVDAERANGSDSQLTANQENREIDKVKLTNDIGEQVTTNDAPEEPPTKCTQNGNRSCCALFAVFTERKLIKGQRFGPYLVDQIESKIESNKPNNLKEENDSKDKESVDKSARELRDDCSEDSPKESDQFKATNQTAQPEAIQVQEPAGFWLKVVRTSSNPTASIRIQGELFFDVFEFSFLEFSFSSEMCSLFSLKISDKLFLKFSPRREKFSRVL